MPELKTAIHLPSLRMPLKKALQTAARLGAVGVELDAYRDVRPAEFTGTALRHLRKLLDDLNLRVAAVSFITRRGYDVADELPRRVEATKAAMQFAYELRASVVVNYVGRVPEDVEGQQAALLRDVLADLGRHGQRVGAFLAARTGPEDPRRLAQLLKALPEGSLAVDLDPGGLITGGFSPLEAIEQLGGAVMHVHARDAVCDPARGRGTEVALGRGEADFPALVGALEPFDYRGFFTLQRDGENAVEELAHGVQFLKSL